MSILHELLLEMNIVNVDAIEEYAAEVAQRCHDGTTRNWLKTKLRKFLNSYEGTAQKVEALPRKAPTWMKTKFEAGEELFSFAPTDDLNEKVHHIIDWLNSLGQYSSNHYIANATDAGSQRLHDTAKRIMDKLGKITFEQASDHADRWFRIVNSYADATEDFSAIEPVVETPNGVWVKLNSEKALEREGKLMGHCVGSYGLKASEIYSFRDHANLPHVTVELRDDEIKQIKGKENKPPIERYIDDVVMFLNVMQRETADGDLRATGIVLDTKTGQFGTVKSLGRSVYEGRDGYAVYAWDGAYYLWKGRPLVTFIDRGIVNIGALTDADALALAEALNALEIKKADRDFASDAWKYIDYDPKRSLWGTPATLSETIANIDGVTVGQYHNRHKNRILSFRKGDIDYAIRVYSGGGVVEHQENFEAIAIRDQVREFLNREKIVSKAGVTCLRSVKLWNGKDGWGDLDPDRVGLDEVFRTERSTYYVPRPMKNEHGHAALDTRVFSDKGYVGELSFTPHSGAESLAEQIPEAYAAAMNQLGYFPSSRKDHEGLRKFEIYFKGKRWITPHTAPHEHQENGMRVVLINSRVSVISEETRRIVVSAGEAERGEEKTTYEVTRYKEPDRAELKKAFVALSNWADRNDVLIAWPHDKRNEMLRLGFWIEQKGRGMVVGSAIPLKEKFPERVIKEYTDGKWVEVAYKPYDLRLGLDGAGPGRYLLNHDGDFLMRVFTRGKVLNKIGIRIEDVIREPTPEHFGEAMAKLLADLIREEDLTPNNEYTSRTTGYLWMGDRFGDPADNPRLKSFLDGRIEYDDGYYWLRGDVEGASGPVSWYLSNKDEDTTVAVAVKMARDGGIRDVTYLGDVSRRPKQVRHHVNDFLDLIHDINGD